MSKLLIITGLPATGKTILSRKIAEHFSIKLLSKDSFKEKLFDINGVKDRDHARFLGQQAYKLLYSECENLLQQNIDLILESNFTRESEEILSNLIKKYNLNCLQILCSCDENVLYPRFVARAFSNDRHKGYLDHIHFPNEKEKLKKDKSYFLDIPAKRHEVDTTDFNKIDYDEIYKIVGEFF